MVRADDGEDDVDDRAEEHEEHARDHLRVPPEHLERQREAVHVRDVCAGERQRARVRVRVRVRVRKNRYVSTKDKAKTRGEEREGRTVPDDAEGEEDDKLAEAAGGAASWNETILRTS